MRTNLEDNRAQDLLISNGFKLGMIDLVPLDNHVITKDYPPIIRANPAGAIDMLLPISNEENRGLVFIITNISAAIITLKTSTDVAFSPAITISVSGGWSMVICTGSSTPNLGWREIASEVAVGT